MGSDARGCAAGSTSRDGVGSAPSRPAVSVADKLRNLADWLDAHPGARPNGFNLIDELYGGTVKVSDFGCETAEEMDARAKAIGGQWEREVGIEITWLQQAIMPGFEYQIVAPLRPDDDGVPF